MSTPNAKPIASKLRSLTHMGLFHFLTPSMMMVVLAVVLVLYLSREMVVPTFMHHIELNGIIFALALYGIFRVFQNNTYLYLTARFIQKIEQVEKSPSATEHDIARLIELLPRDGAMIDVQNTQNALRRMLDSGFFVITDNDARLIKSKIGSRVRYRYNHISFFAGILISFGLLGTFVGLIATVASVGEQMGMISAALSRGEQMNVIDLIAGISKPLSGMGTAFGASLFGLGGSMLLGGLNYLAGHAQDDFMESLSRWIDDRIPVASGATAEKTAVKIGADITQVSGKPLSLDHGAFMVLAEETHKELRTLGAAMQDMMALFNVQQSSTHALQQAHQQHAQLLSALEQRLGQLAPIGGELSRNIASWHSTYGQHAGQQQVQMNELQQTLASVNAMLAQVPGSAETVGKAFQDGARQQAQAQAALAEGLQKLAQQLAHQPMAAAQTNTPQPAAKRGWFRS